MPRFMVWFLVLVAMTFAATVILLLRQAIREEWPDNLLFVICSMWVLGCLNLALREITRWSRLRTAEERVRGAIGQDSEDILKALEDLYKVR